MRARLSIAPAGLMLLIVLWYLPAMADVIRVGGTGAATAMMVHLGKIFTEQTGIAIEVVPGMGSTGGINGAADGVLDIAVSGRPLVRGELARGLVSAVTIRTPYILATKRSEPTSMTEREIIDAYSNEKSNWPDGSPIKVILRPRAESDNLAMVLLFPGMAAALDQARKRTELPIAATGQDIADLAESLPGSLIGATYSQITMEARKLQMVAINGVAPTMEGFESGAYRYAKMLFLIHQQPPSASVAGFIHLIRSESGIRALREAGCLPGGE